MDPMKSVAGEEHERAFSGDEMNPMLAAELDGILSSGSVLADAIHPQPSNTDLCAIFEDAVGYVGRSHEECGFDARLDLTYMREAALALDFGREWIHGHDFVASLGQFAIEGGAEVFRIARQANHREALVGQELINGFASGNAKFHGGLLGSEASMEEAARSVTRATWLVDEAGLGAGGLPQAQLRASDQWRLFLPDQDAGGKAGSSPKGAHRDEAGRASLKRCPDTKPEGRFLNGDLGVRAEDAGAGVTSDKRLLTG